ncbi:hypothetical protein RDI58_020875 [Solanum bulbocastanum]|uniref:Uncharacterized protein n=1 Tax=Solanum bulbocastanum TaxID=147425 RepID=A0AAN8TAP0_SOLBU
MRAKFKVKMSILSTPSGSAIPIDAIVVADDSQGKRILNELEADGIDTSFIVVSQPQVSKGGYSTISFVIVDSQMKTRTSIYTPGYPHMVADDLPDSSLSSALDGARPVYTDGVLQEVALVVSQEAHQRSIPIVINAERHIEGLDKLLHLATYIVCSTKFPQAS